MGLNMESLDPKALIAGILFLIAGRSMGLLTDAL